MSNKNSYRGRMQEEVGDKNGEGKEEVIGVVRNRNGKNGRTGNGGKQGEGEERAQSHTVIACR